MPRLLLLWLLLLSVLPAPGEPLEKPLERRLTDTSGRTVEALITGVTPDTVEFQRRSDGTRFTLPLDQLSEGDRAYVATLRATVSAQQPLRTTPFLALLQRDFVSRDPATSRLRPVPATQWARDRYLILVFSYGWSTGNPFGSSRVEPVPEASRDHPVLWLYGDGSAAEFELVGNVLPPRHAQLTHAAATRELAAALKTYRDYQRAWFDRQRAPGKTTFTFDAEDPAHAGLEARLRKLVPPYWRVLPIDLGGFGRGGRPLPLAQLVDRDGQLVSFRGAEVSGSLDAVVQILRDHAGELAPARATK